MLRSYTLRLLCALALAAGCAAETTPATDGPIREPAGGKADDESLPTLRFTDDFSEAVVGTLREGGAARIDYDLDRLQDCRGTQGGIPQWGATAVYWGADGVEHTVGLTEIVGDELRRTDAVFTVPEGDELGVYVYVNNRWGCIAHDSDYGANYAFPVERAAEDAIVTFTAGETEPQIAGELVAGGGVVVEYDLERLTECRSTRGAYPVWDIATRYRFDGYGREQEASVTRSSTAPGGREPAPARIHLPYDAETLELTFRNFDVYGCEAWDPALGESYQLPIASGDGGGRD